MHLSRLLQKSFLAQRSHFVRGMGNRCSGVVMARWIFVHTLTRVPPLATRSLLLTVRKRVLSMTDWGVLSFPPRWLRGGCTVLIDRISQNGRTPAIHAVMCGHAQCLTVLKELGADLNAADIVALPAVFNLT